MAAYTNKTWESTSLSKETHVIGSKWVFKTQPNPDGTVRFKSRLVVKGYKQIKDIDFKETYAPVSRLATLRITLAFAPEKNWECHQMDVVTASLNPKIDQENILMKLPQPVNPGDLFKFNLERSSAIIRLKKARYGLKQAPRRPRRPRATSEWIRGHVRRERRYRLPPGGKLRKGLGKVRKELAGRFYQLLSGHATTAPHLRRIGQASSDRCFWCGSGERRTRHHLFIGRPRFEVYDRESRRTASGSP